jgi:hypothetical protein
MKPRYWLGLLSAISLLAQDTMHESNTGGKSQTVTVFTKSHVHIDRELLKGLGIGDADTDANGKKKLPPLTEVWRHGHPGPRVLRVIQPEWKKSVRSRDLTGTTIDTNDWVEIELVDAQGTAVGKLTLNREDRPGAGLLTSGHAAFVEKYGKPGTTVDLRACFNACPVCAGGSVQENQRKCEAVKNTVLDVLNNPPSGKLGKSDTVWIYTATAAASQTLNWVAKNPDAEGVRQIIAAKLPSPVEFDFSLTNNGDVENIAMKVLRVRKGAKDGPEVFTAPMPKFSSFEVCSIDEATGASACEPLRECQTFWRRHFNKGCRLYGGLGVFTREGKHHAKGHQHH